MEEHYKQILRDTEERVHRSFARQELNSSHPGYGACYDERGMLQAKYTIYRIASMISLYCNVDSSLYRREELYERILLGLSYVRRTQHESGRFDDVTCNFDSTPDTAFCIKKLIPFVCYFQGIKRTKQEDVLYEEIQSIVLSGAYGLLGGGFHTPNHRWAIASVLMMCWKLFGEEAFWQQSQRYLREGIDCNEDGEYSERSAGNYNRINNDAMIWLSEVTGDTCYERHAVKNLHMLLSYIEPDGTIFTANSTRFDKDHQVYPKDYYIEFLSLGMQYNVPEFLAMANTILHQAIEGRCMAPDVLIQFMLHPSYRTFDTGMECFEHIRLRQTLGNVAHVAYEASGIVRGMAETFTYTILNGKTNFLHMHLGSMRLEFKLGMSFCEHRAFCATTLEELEPGCFHLHQTMHGWYYLPFDPVPDTSDWWKMDHTLRKKTSGPNVTLDVWITERTDGVDVRVKIHGVEGAPMRVEVALQGASNVSSDGFAMTVQGGEVIVPKVGEVRVSNGTDALLLGPAFGAHCFTDGKEDSEAKVAGALTLCFTEYTSLDRTIQIRSERARVLELLR